MVLLLMPQSIEGLGAIQNRLRVDSVQGHMVTLRQRWRTTLPRMVAQSRRQRWEAARSGIAAPPLDTPMPQCTPEQKS